MLISDVEQICGRVGSVDDDLAAHPVAVCCHGIPGHDSDSLDKGNILCLFPDQLTACGIHPVAAGRGNVIRASLVNIDSRTRRTVIAALTVETDDICVSHVESSVFSLVINGRKVVNIVFDRRHRGSAILRWTEWIIRDRTAVSVDVNDSSVFDHHAHGVHPASGGVVIADAFKQEDIRSTLVSGEPCVVFRIDRQQRLVSIGVGSDSVLACCVVNLSLRY